jgi:16S rRNA (cytosine967-C5)-methyltransferase
MPKSQAPAPAREAALDSFATFCGRTQAALETSCKCILKSIRQTPERGASTKAESILRDSIEARGLYTRDAALATEIFNGTLRNLITIDHMLAAFVRTPSTGLDLGILCILRLAAYQITWLDRTPTYAVVNDATEQAKKRHGKGASGFVNGVLRSLLRGIKEPRPFGGDHVAKMSIRHSFPAWIAERWVGRYGEVAAGELMAALNETPGLTLRVNVLKTAREGFIAKLAEAGIEAAPGPYAPEAVRLSSGADVRTLPGYADGLFAVQDEAAMLVSRLLAPKPGGAYLDACAAPGGKTTHIIELGGGSAGVCGMDIALDKIRLINENIDRLGLRGAMPVIADASLPPFGATFDGALVDAPCTGLGVIRRRPEIRYMRKEPDIVKMAKSQLRMLSAVADTVKPGGALVYSTCSTEPEEGEGVVAAFLDGRADYSLEDAGGFLPEGARGLVTSGGWMRTLPHRDSVDGFFAARLVRSK